MKFRKKPVVIEATQWFKMGDHPEVLKAPDGYGTIYTLEGAHTVTPGDWIITGVKGEHYPCKPDIFEMAYEPVDMVFEYKSWPDCPRGMVDTCCNNPADCRMEKNT